MEKTLEEKMTILFEGMTLDELFKTQKVLGRAIERLLE